MASSVAGGDPSGDNEATVRAQGQVKGVQQPFLISRENADVALCCRLRREWKWGWLWRDGGGIVEAPCPRIG